MSKYLNIPIILLLICVNSLTAQHTDANIFGDVQSNGEHIPFVNIYLDGTNIGTTTDETGHFMLIDLPEGECILVAKAVGYKTIKKEVLVEKGKSKEVNFSIEEEIMPLNEVVITGTKTFKRQTESPVIVNILDSKALNDVQACNISEGLRFQPGLRVETDCQTCNYTQLRMNGLGGSYSQILINGRPVFSPLTGLYGMEQIPSNMVDRIEVVRGGGSALYGSSAVGGTVNIITRIPTKGAYDFSIVGNSINGKTSDYILSGNINMLTRQRNAGASIFVNLRRREAYDHNGDNFSELPELRNNSFGANLFFKPKRNQKLELNFLSLHEYRYGGEMVDKPAYLTQQSEERSSYVFMGGLDYQINFNNDNSSFIAYFAGQLTDRDHYTGIFPDDPEEIIEHVKLPPYGYTENSTLQLGTQFNHRFGGINKNKNTLTVGAEYVVDDVMDTIQAYNYKVDQLTRNFGLFVQDDWKIVPNLTLLAGIRMDKHNLVDHVIFSPRFSLLYQLQSYTQFRLTYGTGFRAPQAFDSDLHIAFAGGGVSRIYLSPDLSEERSQSFSGSVNFDKPAERFIIGFTLEGFYTKLNNAFYLQPAGEDEYGFLFEKRNGPGAHVGGGTIELRGNWDRKIQLEAGFTLQNSLYDEPVEYIEGLESKREFLRTPNEYGYFIFSYTPTSKFSASLSSVYTGPMLLVHFAGAPEQQVDEYTTSPSFAEFSIKLAYTLEFKEMNSGIEFFGGIKNFTNAYQNDFDSGKNRDSNYVYGPAAPRTFFFGLRFKSL